MQHHVGERGIPWTPHAAIPLHAVHRRAAATRFSPTVIRVGNGAAHSEAPDQLGDALREAIRSDAPTVLDVQVDPKRGA